LRIYDTSCADVRISERPSRGDEAKADEATGAIPIVIVSADANKDTLRRLGEAGASSFVTKPLNVGLFLETIDEMLGQVRAATVSRTASMKAVANGESCSLSQASP
jgi:CheY-like chemotaxis protein